MQQSKRINHLKRSAWNCGRTVSTWPTEWVASRRKEKKNKSNATTTITFLCLSITPSVLFICFSSFFAQLSRTAHARTLFPGVIVIDLLTIALPLCGWVMSSFEQHFPSFRRFHVQHGGRINFPSSAQQQRYALQNDCPGRAFSVRSCSAHRLTLTPSAAWACMKVWDVTSWRCHLSTPFDRTLTNRYLSSIIRMYASESFTRGDGANARINRRPPVSACPLLGKSDLHLGRRQTESTKQQRNMKLTVHSLSARWWIN